MRCSPPFHLHCIETFVATTATTRIKFWNRSVPKSVTANRLRLKPRPDVALPNSFLRPLHLLSIFDALRNEVSYLPSVSKHTGKVLGFYDKIKRRSSQYLFQILDTARCSCGTL